MSNEPRASIPTRALQAVWIAGPIPLYLLAAEASKKFSAGAPATIVAESLILLAWAAGLVAVIRLRPAWLAAPRMGAAAASVWGAAGILGEIGIAAVLALAWGLVALVLTFSPQVATDAAGRECAPRERRFPLAIPLGLMIAMVLPTTFLAGGGIGLIPAWILGVRPTGALALLAVASIVAIAVVAISLSRLAKRWLVVVPAGVVIHDPLLLTETYRLTPAEIAWVELAPPKWRQVSAGDDVSDVTGGCVSRPVVLVLNRPTPAPLVRPARTGTTGLVSMVVCRPVDRADALATMRDAGFERPATEDDVEGADIE